MQLPAENARESHYVMTAEAVRELEAELADLRTRKRREIAGRLEEARSEREVPEIGEYREVGVDEQLIETRITRLEELLAKVRVADPGVHPVDTAGLGSLVRVKDTETEREADYRIVAFDGTTLPPGSVSASSPVGQALLGAAAGELATVELPDGRRRTLRVLAVSQG